MLLQISSQIKKFHSIMSVSHSSTSLLSVALLITIRVSSTAKNCAELQQKGQTISGVFRIDPDGLGAFDVYCDQTTDGGGWTVFQRRMNRSVNFNRTFDDYKRGFGDFLIGEFWLGLQKIYRLTKNEPENKLRVDLGVRDIKTVYAEYAEFRIGDENSDYTLNLGNLLSKTVAKDSLTHHNGAKFGTANTQCGLVTAGGWWYNQTKSSCSAGMSNLNGAYGKAGNGKIHWGGLDSSDAVYGSTPSASEMKIRPAKFS